MMKNINPVPTRHCAPATRSVTLNSACSEFFGRSECNCRFRFFHSLFTYCLLLLGIALSIIFLFNPLKTEAAKIVTSVYTTDDVVVADYDVLDYGADITGFNDATSAIQNAINDCYNSGGGTVWMPAGTYKITNTIFVKSFVTLRGDWRDPDISGVGYGTVISAQVASGISGTILFQIGGSAGVMGLTVYYPDQNADNPVPYNFTFNLGASPGMSGTYMANNVINCTMLNSYCGIGKSAIDNSQVNECATIRNVKGTVLYRGAVVYNSADVDTWSHINFNNSYWADAGTAFNAPDIGTLNVWTRANGIAYLLGDLEWDQFYDIRCSDYNIGINMVQGSRASFCGEFLYSTITNTNIAVKADVMDDRWGASFLRCVLDGSTESVQNNSSGFVKITDCILTGSYSGIVQIYSPGTSPEFYGECSNVPKVTRSVLYDVTNTPYNAPFMLPQTGLPTVDATSAIQSALNDAGNQGGGVVYLPAGWYKISTHLIVPANVELRGCSSVPQLDQSDLSLGTTIMGYEGHNTPSPQHDTALITLNGNTSGISGIRFFYPNNNPANGVNPYPFTIRGSGTNLYAINLGLTGVYNAIDFGLNQCDNHLVRNVSGAIYNRGIVIGASSNGWIENCLTNPSKADRCVYGVPGWISESNVFTQLIDPVTKVYQKHIIVNSASDEKIMNCFSYGSNIGLWVQSGIINCFNFGTDNVGIYTIRADCGNAGTSVMNVMRYNGTTSSGAITIYNEMYLSDDLNPVMTSPGITSTPPVTGTVGTLYSYAVATSGSPTPSISVTGNPSWLVLNDNILSGIPPTDGTFGTITVIASNSASCPNAEQTFSIGVTFNSLPAQAATPTGILTLCQNPSNTVYTTTGATNASTYIWDLQPANAGIITLDITQKNATIDWNDTFSGNATLTVLGHNSLGDGISSNPLTITIEPIPDAAGTITGTSTVCQNQALVSYTVPVIADASSYVWSLPAGTTGTSTTNSIDVNFTDNAVSGVITVAGQNSCGVGIGSNFTVTVDLLPASAGTISGLTNVCEGQTLVSYSVPVLTDADYYVWSLPTGATGTSSTNSINVDFSNSAVSGDISVYGQNFCGVGAASILSITVNPVPTAFAGNDTTICQGSNITLTATGGSQYIWDNSVSQGVFFVPASTATYNVTVTNSFNCSSTDSILIIVNSKPNPVISVTGSLNFCQGDSVTLDAGSGFESYQWSNNDTTQLITVKTQGSYIVVVTNSFGCTSTSGSVSVIVNNIPATPVITQNQNTLTSNSATGNQWYDSNGLIIGETNQTYTATADGNYYVIVTANGCSSSQSNTINVIIIGITEINLNTSVNIYPNPVKDELTVETNSTIKQKCEILNILGESVYISTVEKKVIFDVSQLNSGIYFVKVYTEKHCVVKKIVKD